MLVNVTIEDKEAPIENPQKGIYILLVDYLPRIIKEKAYSYFRFDNKASYGVCDNVEQVLEQYGQWLDLPDRKFCISLIKHTKEDGSGFRWHKNGKYIGIKEPQMEYLRDEGDDIQEVFSYNIHEILD